jgi:hypothetical protein
MASLETLALKGSAMKHIRPWQIFKHLGENNRVQMIIPTVRGSESLTVFAIETQLLIAAARIVNAKTILEIGTSLGYTTMHLAMNTNAIIETVDIEQKPVVFDENHPRICRVIGNSANLAIDQTDFVFIDGDHSYEGVSKDTAIAFKCEPKVIAWHDYSEPTTPGVTQFLDDISEEFTIYHVEDTKLAFWFSRGLDE